MKTKRYFRRVRKSRSHKRKQHITKKYITKRKKRATNKYQYGGEPCTPEEYKEFVFQFIEMLSDEYEKIHPLTGADTINTVHPEITRLFIDFKTLISQDCANINTEIFNDINLPTTPNGPIRIPFIFWLLNSTTYVDTYQHVNEIIMLLFNNNNKGHDTGGAIINKLFDGLNVLVYDVLVNKRTHFVSTLASCGADINLEFTTEARGKTLSINLVTFLLYKISEYSANHFSLEDQEQILEKHMIITKLLMQNAMPKAPNSEPPIINVCISSPYLIRLATIFLQNKEKYKSITNLNFTIPTTSGASVSLLSQVIKITSELNPQTYPRKNTTQYYPQYILFFKLAVDDTDTNLNIEDVGEGGAKFNLLMVSIMFGNDEFVDVLLKSGRLSQETLQNSKNMLEGNTNKEPKIELKIKSLINKIQPFLFAGKAATKIPAAAAALSDAELFAEFAEPEKKLTPKQQKEQKAQQQEATRKANEERKKLEDAAKARAKLEEESKAQVAKATAAEKRNATAAAKSRADAERDQKMREALAAQEREQIERALKESETLAAASASISSAASAASAASVQYNDEEEAILKQISESEKYRLLSLPEDVRHAEFAKIRENYLKTKNVPFTLSSTTKSYFPPALQPVSAAEQVLNTPQGLDIFWHNVDEYTHLNEFKIALRSAIALNTNLGEKLKQYIPYYGNADPRGLPIFRPEIDILMIIIGFISSLYPNIIIIKGGRSLQFSLPYITSDIDVQIEQIDSSIETDYHFGVKIVKLILWIIKSDNLLPSLTHSSVQLPPLPASFLLSTIICKGGIRDAASIIKISVQPQPGRFNALCDINFGYTRQDPNIKSIMNKESNRSVTNAEIQKMPLSFFYVSLDSLVEEKIYNYFMHYIATNGNVSGQDEIYDTKTIKLIFKLFFNITQDAAKPKRSQFAEQYARLDEAVINSIISKYFDKLPKIKVQEAAIQFKTDLERVL